jgi:hypothetical protein
VDAIGTIDPKLYDMVLLAGGEPSLEIPLIRVAIDACKRSGLLSAIVTAPVWAPKPSAAEHFLDRISGLDILILSYDSYHLEFLEVAHYERAILAAAKRSLLTVLQVCYGEKPEISDLLHQLASLRHFFRVTTTRTVRIGNAARPGNVARELIAIKRVEDLAQIPRGCTMGNVLIDENHVVHGCCWARSAGRSRFSEPGSSGLRSALDRLESNSTFQAIRARGFLDALTPVGQEALVHLVSGREFGNECDICITAMREGNAAIWEHVEPFSRAPQRSE